MKISRRQFNALAVANLSLASMNAWGRTVNTSSNEHIVEGGLSILQGATDARSTQFSIVAKKNRNYEFDVVEDASGIHFTPSIHNTEQQEFSEFIVIKLKYDRLRLGENYKLICKEDGQVIDTRNFKTLDPGRSGIRFSIHSCMHDNFHKSSIWEKLNQQRPDICFFIGDTVYADHYKSKITDGADLEQFWYNYSDARYDLDFYKFKDLIPTYAVWDDHDYGANNSDRNFAHKQDALYIYNTFFAHNESSDNLIHGPGVAKKIETQGLDFIMLDGRYFRSEEGAADETLFGKEQERWLFNNIDPSKPTLLMMGSQWFGLYRKKESFDFTHPNDMKNFLHKLQSINAKVFFASGDIHYSELMKIEEEQLGYETLELTSSAMHSMRIPFQDRFRKNPRRLDSTSKSNFMMLNAAGDGNKLNFIVECFSTNRKPRFSFEVELFANSTMARINKMG